MNQSLYNLTQHYLKIIYKLNPELNAFITVTEQEALLTAMQLDSEIEAAQVKRLLYGIPIAIKDNIDTANIVTTIGTKLFHQRTPVVDADIVTRLKQAGAIILGKTNLSEFGADISDNSYQKAQKQRLWEFGDIQNIFRQVDAIITPTTPTTAPNIQADAKIYQLNRTFVLPFSYFGFPCISIPCGLSPQGLPIGLQIVANSFQDKLILKIAEDLESIINYYLIK